MERTIANSITGFNTQDGAGVHLVRVLGRETAETYDPILLLDSFDSTNPDDYTAGFPMHPHRGIETISYVYRGRMTHRDSLGNEDTIGDGEVQWMTAGSGIMHEEKLPASDRMLGVQLWLNLPAASKMCPPAYMSIKSHEIEEIAFETGKLRLLAGVYEGHSGFQGHYLPLNYYDIHLQASATKTFLTDEDHMVTLFTLSGDCYVAGERVKEKTAIKLTAGTQVTLKAGETNAQILFVSSKPLNEPIAWAGPIVMNTRAELDVAFDDLRKGTFLQQEIEY